jgi:RNA polymerase-associated protein LEO1
VIYHKLRLKLIYFRPKRTIDDEELDSGDDEGRADRLDSDSQASEKADLVASATELPRHVVPDPNDNEVCSLKTAFTIQI